MDISKEVYERAKQHAEKNGLEQMFVNEQGEMFTSQNLAALSVNHDPKRWSKLTFTPQPADDYYQPDSATGENGSKSENPAVTVRPTVKGSGRSNKKPNSDKTQSGSVGAEDANEAGENTTASDAGTPAPPAGDETVTNNTTPTENA